MIRTEDQVLLRRLPARSWRDNGVPSTDQARRQERLISLASSVLVDALVEDGLQTSPLGPGWSTDVDAHVKVNVPEERMLAQAWIPLKGLLHHLGVCGANAWAVVEEREVLGLLDIQTRPPPAPVEAVLERCMRRGEVRLREVLELRCLLRAGTRLPERHPALRAAAAAEAALGANMLAPWRQRGSTKLPPVPIPRAKIRRALGRALRRHHDEYVVAISGMDGAGKTRLVADLAEMMERLGLATTIVWSRPGMGLGPLDAIVRTVKRVVTGEEAPTMRAPEGSTRPRSRAGALGWCWALVITTAFLVDVRRQHRGPGSLKLYDRHMLDALATLDYLYEGVALAAHRTLIKHLLPRASVTLWLDVSPEEAATRKPDAVFHEEAARHQYSGYARYAPLAPNLHRIDAAGDPIQVTGTALKIVLGGPLATRDRDLGD